MITLGSTRLVDAAFRSGGVLTDTTVTLTITAPDGTVTTPTPTHDGTGLYSYVLLLDQVGAWRIEWDGTGAVPAVGYQTLVVHDPNTVNTTCEPWATSADACAPCNTYEFDTVLLDEKMAVATDVLFNLTGRRWPGICTDVIRPQAQYRSFETPRWWPSDGSGYGWCSCNRGRETGCAAVPEIRLPGHPVVAASVLIDGEAFTDFRIDDGRWLVRTDGEGWPCCQDLTAAVDDLSASTFQVSYSWGSEPPAGGIAAAAALGCQYALACDPDAVNDGTCRLPKYVTSITRAGTTMSFADPMKLVKDGLTGIPEVDQWVNSILLGDKRRRGRVLVPGSHRSARRTS